VVTNWPIVASPLAAHSTTLAPRDRLAAAELGRDQQPERAAPLERALGHQPAAVHREIDEQRSARPPAGLDAHRRSHVHARAAALLGSAIERVHDERAQRGRMHGPPHDQRGAGAAQRAAQRARVVSEDRDLRRRRSGGRQLEVEDAPRRRDHEIPRRLAIGLALGAEPLDERDLERAEHRAHV
jgi:hypothetical protein